MIRYGLENHLEEIRPIYREKRDAMIAALERYMPEDAGITWTNPEGGLFVWMRLPEGIDTTDMLQDAIEHKVAYVPGASSYVDGRGQNTIRLSYSLVTPELIDEGIRRLAGVVKTAIEAKQVAAGAR
jgi:2-aminoadipate transaminase